MIPKKEIKYNQKVVRKARFKTYKDAYIEIIVEICLNIALLISLVFMIIYNYVVGIIAFSLALITGLALMISLIYQNDTDDERIEAYYDNMLMERLERWEELADLRESFEKMKNGMKDRKKLLKEQRKLANKLIKKNTVKMYAFREHRGGLDEAMKTVKYFNSKEEILEYVKTLDLYKDLKPKQVKIDKTVYAKEDKRINWKNIQLVLFDDYAVGWVGEVDKIEERGNE